MPISDFCIRNVATIKKVASIHEAIEVMRSYDVDDLVVVENKDNYTVPCGFVTGHDIIMKAFGFISDESQLIVGDIMSTKLISCNENSGVQDTIKMMQKNEVKRLPVVDDFGVLVGIVTTADLLEIISEELIGLTQRKRNYYWSDHLIATALPGI